MKPRIPPKPQTLYLLHDGSWCFGPIKWGDEFDLLAFQYGVEHDGDELEIEVDPDPLPTLWVAHCHVCGEKFGIGEDDLTDDGCLPKCPNCGAWLQPNRACS